MSNLPPLLSQSASTSAGPRFPACPPELFDGYLVHSAALETSFSATLLPGQVLLLRRAAAETPTLSFAHGVPEQTTLATATMVQDNRVRRALLQPHKIPVPKGASFSVGRGTPGATAFAKKIGYPVVVKPMVGDSTIETLSGVQDKKSLRKAIRYFRTAPTHRGGFTTASYAFTAVHTPKEEGSTEARGTYRYLVEKQISGQYLRILVFFGKVVSVVYAPEGPWNLADIGGEILPEVHPSVLELAERVCTALPGLAVAAVDVLLTAGHEVPTAEQDHAVVEVSERPWLHVQGHFSRENAAALGRRLLHDALAANSVEATPSGRSSQVATEVRWQGVSDMETFVRQVREVAAAFGITGWIEPSDPVGGVAVGRMDGQANEIALVHELAVAGEFPGERIMAIDTSPVGAADGQVADFSVRR